METLRPQLSPDARAGLVWANPRLGEPPSSLPAAIFTEHEEILTRLAAALGLTALPHCPQATRKSLATYLETHQPLGLLSLLAHGTESGGGLLLHAAEHPDYPADSGDIVTARDLAAQVQAAGVEIVLLWSCFGGRHHPVLGSLAETLLAEEQGRVGVVLASHAAVRGAAVSRVLEALLRALQGPAEGNLELAVGLARHALEEGDLQWAAPAYYSRTVEPVVLGPPTPAAEAAEPIPGAALQLEFAPLRSPWFQGREPSLAEGLALLRRQRLVTLVGPPGIGKTELSLALAEEALQAGEPPLQRAVWLSLQGLATAEFLLGRLGVLFGIEKCETAEQLAKAIGDGPVLLVLDNAEDLLREDRGGFLEALGVVLRHSRGARFLLTSRRELGPVSGHPEAVVPIDRLEPPADRALFEAAASDQLSPEESESAEARQLVALLGGHPLSLVLAASRVGRDLTLHQLSERLRAGEAGDLRAFEDEPFEPETGDAPAHRQRNLAASLWLSYEPLLREKPRAAEAFLWLGLFPAGLPGALVPAIFGAEGLEAMGALLRGSLVAKRGIDDRLTLLAPIRLVARRNLDGLHRERRRELLTATWSAYASWVSGTYGLLGDGRTRRAVGIALAEQPNLAELLKLTLEPDSDRSSFGDLADSLGSTLGAWSGIVSFADKPT
ncbi:MAG TPA: NB-ARC domain-containing protein, partial [Thermoanaerobaculia bacterium]|nr:NB-ARC domain-containing protein [Thermoanaerobaculia bacterium]